MQWAVENLPNHTLYSSGDDDVFVNLIELNNLMEEKMIHFTKTIIFPITCVYGGRVNDPVCRIPKYNCYISKE